MITKKQALLLAAYEFKVVDKEGYKCNITGLNENVFRVVLENGFHFAVNFSNIGVDYFILCRPYSQLTEEIEHGGERFVPLVELSKLAYGELYEVTVGGGDFDSFNLDEIEIATKNICSSEKTLTVDLAEKINDWNFKPQWLDEKFVKYINQ